jgi:YVTN family beta-propeller protein
MKRSVLWLIGIALGSWAFGASQEKHPVYVGARVCGGCHDGAGMNHQYSQWLLSKHSNAYAVLVKPHAAQIARLSGIPQQPQESPMCLGCHATAVEAESWEKDPTFLIEDGVQCEKCHGAGSEYMAAEVMISPMSAMMAGLRMPAKTDCTVCHYVKGSHAAVHGHPPLDLDKAWEQMAHHTPVNPAPKQPVSYSMAAKAGAKFVGSAACGRCHKGPMMGGQYSVWRMSAHARAYAALAGPKAFEIARAKGLDGEPQTLAACLKCHTTGQGFRDAACLPFCSPSEGVGCEECHGAGSDYATEAVMRDKPTARDRGLHPVDSSTCLRCHEGAHEKAFDLGQGMLAIARARRAPAPAESSGYKTPVNLAISPDGRWLCVACESSDSVIVVDTTSRAKVAEIAVGGQPADVTFRPDGKVAYVSNRLDDSVSVIDVASRSVIKTLPVGDEPHGVLTDKPGKLLYVLNTSTDDISIYDTESFEQLKRISASRGPWSLALSPEGGHLLVTNTLARLGRLRTPPLSEITLVNTEYAAVEARLLVPEANLLQGICWSPNGEFALATLNRTKTLAPMTQLTQGWTITNGLAIIWKEGRVDQVLLDEPNLGFSDATDVVFTPDGRFALVTSCTSDRVAVVDVEALLSIIRQATPKEREEILPNHRGKATEFVQKHIRTERAPRGLLVSPDGRLAYVCNSLDDSLTVLDLGEMESVDRIDLGGRKEITKTRLGERLFNDSKITFQRQFACHSCHPDGHIDGMIYDIEADGIGISHVDNRTLRGINDTPPFKWEGTNPSLSRQCGARLAVFFTRGAPFTAEELAAVDNYVCTIPRPPNRYRPLGAPLTEAQRRGRAIFERTMTNDGREIPVDNRCVTCHCPPLYTDRTKRDVGTREKLDRTGLFDVPHLNNIYDSAPYLHNGMAPTLEEIWTVYNPRDQHGVTNDMTKDQLNDLIEYLKTL